MERKAKIGFDGVLIVGIVFAILGPILIAVGISVFLAVPGEGNIIFLSVYGSMGLIFLAIGLAFLVIKIRRKQQCNRLLQSGSYIMAEIAETKMPDLNAATVEAAMSMVAGTCRSMGVKVEEA